MIKNSIKVLVGLFFCSSLLFAQSETLVIDALDFKADDNKGISTFTGNFQIRMAEDKFYAQPVDALIYFISSPRVSVMMAFTAGALPSLRY